MEPSGPPPPPLPAPQASPAPVAPPRNWWQRNWKWFVPTGCLTLVALGVVFILGIMLIVFSAMKSSDAYKIALARAKADPRVEAAIGTPIKAGLFVSGSTNVTGESGTSDITIPIHGPKGEAKIYAIATKEEGEWKYSTLVVKIADTGEKIDLAEAPESE